MGILRFSNGAVGTVHYNATVQLPDVTSHLHLFGTNTRTIHAIGNNHVTLTDQNAYRRWYFPAKGTKAWGHRQTVQHFTHCVLHGTSPLVTPDDAIAAQQIAAQIVASTHEAS